MDKIKKVIGIIILFAALSLGGFCLLWGGAAKAIFYNLKEMVIARDLKEDNWTGGKSYYRVPYSGVSDANYVDIFIPDDVENPPLLIMVHGGGFIFGDSESKQAQQVIRYFRDHGFACASVNYRLSQEAAYPAAIEDVKECVAFLKENGDIYGYDVNRVSIAGESAGGYLACAVALSEPDEFDTLIDFYGAMYFDQVEDMWEELRYPDFVISIANSWLKGDMLEGFSDVHSYWLRREISDLTKEEYDDFLMTSFIENNLTEDCKLKIYICHGDCDITVPILVSEQFYEETSHRLGDNQVVLNIVEHAGHATESIFTDQELNKIAEFVIASGTVLMPRACVLWHVSGDGSN